MKTWFDLILGIVHKSGVHTTERVLEKVQHRFKRLVNDLKEFKYNEILQKRMKYTRGEKKPC